MTYLETILLEYKELFKEYSTPDKLSESFFTSENFSYEKLREQIFELTNNSDKIHLLRFLTYKCSNEIKRLKSLKQPSEKINNLMSVYLKIESEKSKWKDESKTTVNKRKLNNENKISILDSVLKHSAMYNYTQGNLDIVQLKNIDLSISNENDIDEIKKKINLLNSKKDYLIDILFKGRYEKSSRIFEDNNDKPTLTTESAPLDESQKKEIEKIINYYNLKIDNFNNMLKNLELKPLEIPMNTNKNIDNVEKIIWKKDKKELAFLISELMQYDFIPEHKHINKLISKHFSFLNKKKKNLIEDIKPDEISDLKSKLKNPIYPLNPSKEIKEIVNKLKKNK